MKKKIWMMLLCGALVCFQLGGCGINRADADTGSVQSEAVSDHKTTKTAMRSTPVKYLPWILI